MIENNKNSLSGIAKYVLILFILLYPIAAWRGLLAPYPFFSIFLFLLYPFLSLLLWELWKNPFKSKSLKPGLFLLLLDVDFYILAQQGFRSISHLGGDWGAAYGAGLTILFYIFVISIISIFTLILIGRGLNEMQKARGQRFWFFSPHVVFAVLCVILGLVLFSFRQYIF